MTRSDTTTDDVNSDSGDPGLTGSDTTVTSGDEKRGTMQRLTDRVTSLFGSDIEAREFTNVERHRIHEDTITHLSEGDGRLLRIEPSPEGQSIGGAQELFEGLSALAEIGPFGLQNNSPVMSFEIWMVDDEVTFNMFVPNDDVEMFVLKELDAIYSAAAVERVWEASEVRAFLNRQMETGEYTDRGSVPLPDDKIPMPPISNAKYITGAEFEMEMPRVHPIKTEYGAEEGTTVRKQDDPEMKKNDPYKAVISQMIADNRNHFVMQVVFSPAKDEWANKWWWYYDPTRTSIKNLEEDYTLSDRHMSADDTNDAEPVSEYINDVQERAGNPGFRAELRVLGYGANETTIRQGVKGISGAIKKHYDGQEQGPDYTGVNGDALLNMLDSVVARNLTPARVPWREYNPSMYLSASETAMFAHLPNNDVESNMVAWQRQSIGNQIPSGAERIGEVLASTPTFPLNRKPIRIPPDPDRFEDDTTLTGTDAITDADAQTTTASADNTDQGEDDMHDTQTTTTSADSTGTGTGSEEDTATGKNTADDFDWLHENAGAVKYCVNQSRWVSAKLYGLGAVLGLLGIGIVLYAMIEWTLLEFGVGVTTTGAGIGVAYYEKLRRRNRWYAVTEKMVYIKTGILSLHTDHIKAKNIRSVGLSQNPVEKRVLNVGTVEVGTSSQDKSDDILYSYAKDPVELKHAIQTLTDQQSEHEGDEQ